MTTGDQDQTAVFNLTRRGLLRSAMLGSAGSLLAAGGLRFAPAAIAQTPVSGGSLNVAIHWDVFTLDPRVAGTNNAGRLTAHPWSNALIRLSEQLTFEPELAERWERSTDGLTWTFYLRQGVTFHDGSPFTAQDVKYTIESVMDPALQSPFLTDWVINEVPTTVTVIDDYTVTITFPEAPPEPLVAIAYQRIVPKAYGEQVGYDGFNEHPIGTGPFKFVEFLVDDRLVFERNPDYWQPELPYLDELIFRIIPNAGTRLAALQAEEVWIATINPDDFPLLEGDDRFQIERYMLSGYYYLAFNLRDPLVADKRVRQAVAYAIDSEEIITTIGLGEIAHNMLPPAMPGYDPNAPKYTLDPAKSAQLLTEAGYADGIDLAISGFTLPPYQRIAEIVQNQLERTGLIRAELTLVDWTVFTTDVFTNFNFQAGVSAFTGVTPAQIFGDFYSGTAAEPSGFTGYRNPEVDALIKEAETKRESDPERTLAIYQQLQAMILDDAPMIFLGYWGAASVVRSEVQGFLGHPNQSFEFYEKVWLSQ